MDFDQTTFAAKAVTLGSAEYYSKSYLPEPGPDFYPHLGREVIPVLGYEYKTTDYQVALEHINQRLKLQLDEIDLKVFSLMLNGLSGARRFRGDLHISELMGENSAAHSIHCPILATEFFRLAELLSRGSQVYDVMQLRLDICIGLLLHDMGEILGELSSLAQRTTDNSLEELPDVEREIFQIALTEAYRAVTTPGMSAISFYQFLDQMREEAGIGQAEGGGSDFKRVLATIESHKERQQKYPFSWAIQQRLDFYLSRYDMAELKEKRTSDYSTFVGNTVKVIEHLQGLRHLLRFATIDPSDTRLNVSFPSRLPNTQQNRWVKESLHDMIPTRYASHYRMRKNALYMHSGVRQMCESASSGIEKALAQVVRDKLYQGMAEWLSITRPVFDKSIQQEDKFLVQLQRNYATEKNGDTRVQVLQNIRNFSRYLIEQDMQDPRLARNASTSYDTLPEMLTRSEMIGLYLKAIEVNFTPKDDTPFTLFTSVPEELRGFEKIDYQTLLTEQARCAEVSLSNASFSS